MKLASMLESMFFITLGISCVLLLMLFYHFKQRINKLEQSSETMFEILNNMVQELSSIKRGDSMCFPSASMPMSQNAPTFTSVPSNKIQVELSEDETSLPDLIDENGNVINDDVSDVDDDNESSEYETDSDNNSDSENDENTIKEGSDTEKGDDDSVKVISVDIDESLDNLEYIPESVVSDANENIDETEEPPVEINTDMIEKIQVNKIEGDRNLEENDDVSHSSVNTSEVYKKMNVPSLKSLVIEKGLASDPSKMKKNDLITLLESNQ
jgi:hypothetical protein